ncbi:MAG: hypothetical protein M2R45_02967 [Verrucomicrobia subdivision 3 bacterium]|nr:hypothetical protein [Limisphaerales bacterium]MCS1415313.1 hypothetical protein [Limisphaerales bacterium]
MPADVESFLNWALNVWVIERGLLRIGIVRHQTGQQDIHAETGSGQGAKARHERPLIDDAVDTSSRDSRHLFGRPNIMAVSATPCGYSPDYLLGQRGRYDLVVRLRSREKTFRVGYRGAVACRRRGF